MSLDDLQAGGEDLTALGAAGVLDHVVIYEPLPPAPDYKRSVQFSIFILYSSVWIRSHLIRIRIRIQGFDDLNWKKITAEIFFIIKNYSLHLSLGPCKGRLSY